MSSIETGVYIYVGFIAFLLVIQLVALFYYICLYDCCYVNSLCCFWGGGVSRICSRIKYCTACQNWMSHQCSCLRPAYPPALLDLEMKDTKEYPLMECQMYEQL